MNQEIIFIILNQIIQEIIFIMKKILKITVIILQQIKDFIFLKINKAKVNFMEQIKTLVTNLQEIILIKIMNQIIIIINMKLIIKELIKE